MRRFGLTVLTLAPVLALLGMAGSATAYPVQYCAGVPIINGPRRGAFTRVSRSAARPVATPAATVTSA